MPTSDGRIKVLILLPNLVSGGGQKIVVDLARCLNRDGFQPHLLVHEQFGSFTSEVQCSLAGDEVEYLLDRPFRRSDLPRLLLRTFARARQSDVVVCGLEGRASALGLIAAKLARKPTVCWIHIDWSPFSQLVSWRQTLSLRAYRLADNVVACSQGAADNFSELFSVPREKTLPINNMIPCKRVERNASVALPPEHASLFDKPTVVMVGRLETQKGYPYLIEAHAQLIDNGLSHNLVIIGEGSELSKLKAIVKERRVESSVYFLGFQTNPHRYMKRATVFALSSEFEGFGLVLAEALTCGVPVVATDCLSGPAEILDWGKYGLLVRPQDSSELAEALGRMLTEPDLRQRYADLAHERGLDFDETRVVPHWEMHLAALAGR